MPDHPKPPCLIVLDVQDAIDQPVWEGKNNPGYLATIQTLLAHWRSQGWLVVHVRHDEPTPTSSYHTLGPWNGFKTEVAPIEGEHIIAKSRNSAFINTELDLTLRALSVERIVLTGVVIHNSMDATIRAGKALGYDIVLPADATTAVPVTGLDGKVWDAQTVYDLTLAVLNGEYATVTTAREVIEHVS